MRSRAPAQAGGEEAVGAVAVRPEPEDRTVGDTGQQRRRGRTIQLELAVRAVFARHKLDGLLQLLGRNALAGHAIEFGERRPFEGFA